MAAPPGRHFVYQQHEQQHEQQKRAHAASACQRPDVRYNPGKGIPAMGCDYLFLRKPLPSSMPSLKSTARLHALFVAILIAALLSSHWQGLAHRIGHASRMLAGSETVELARAPTAIADDDLTSALLPEQQGAGHACLAFDAATVGAFLCTAPFVIAVPQHAPVMALWLAFISWMAPFTAHFSSRAPPQS